MASFLTSFFIEKMEVSVIYYLYVSLLGLVFGLLLHALRNKKRIILPGKMPDGSVFLGFIFDVIASVLGAVFVFALYYKGEEVSFLMILIISLIGASVGESILLRFEKNKVDVGIKLQSEIDEELSGELDEDV